MSLQVQVCALDAFHGRPAAGVPLAVSATGVAGWTTVARGITDDDGCWTGGTQEVLRSALVRIVLDTGRYFAALGTSAKCEETVIGMRLSTVTPSARLTVVLAPASCTVHVQTDGMP
jgi:5-hydroxyisourate hydrolase